MEDNLHVAWHNRISKGKNVKELARTVIHLLSPFKEHIKSITTDNGTEFACYEMIGKRLDATIYFIKNVKFFLIPNIILTFVLSLLT